MNHRESQEYYRNKKKLVEATKKALVLEEAAIRKAELALSNKTHIFLPIRGRCPHCANNIEKQIRARRLLSPFVFYCRYCNKELLIP